MHSPCSQNVSSTREKGANAVEKEPRKNVATKPDENRRLKQQSSTKKHGTVRASPLELETFTPPTYPKSDVEEMFLFDALRRNFIFSSLSQQEMFSTVYPLIDSMEKVHFEEGDVIIRQGDMATFCYVIFEGSCSVSIDGNTMSEPLQRGATFGELGLLFESPRAATVTALDKVELFRVDQITFRQTCQFHVESHLEHKRKRLEGVPFLAELSESDKRKAMDSMTLRVFKKGEQLIGKGDDPNLFWILDEGTLKIHDLEIAEGNSISDILLDPGEYFGQSFLFSGRPLAGNVSAMTDGRAFVVDKDHFVDVVGTLDQARARGLTRKLLEAVRVIKNSRFASETLDAMVKLIRIESFAKGSMILKQGQETEAALYLIRSGSVRLFSTKKKEIVMHDVGIFGEDMILLDARNGRNSPDSPTKTNANCTVEAMTDVVVSMLKLQDCRRVINTKELGKAPHLDSILHTNLKVDMSHLTKHSMLGEGQFGQVWLVTRTTSVGKERAYALKVQSKRDLLLRHQAKGAARERDLMAQMHHPFVTRLVASFQDATFVYMLMDFLQGGELESIMHSDSKPCLSEDEASFYAAGIVEGLSYMHRLGVVYRDLKPQNVLINDLGYPVLADFGFAKTLPPSGHTFTFCGTPEYIAPEIIVNRGHGLGVDYYSFGVLCCEMLTGQTPFHHKRDDQSELFRAVVQDEVQLTATISPSACSLLSGLLEKNPRKRLGIRANGSEDIEKHSWFKSIDFYQLTHMTVVAPAVPECRDIRDVSNFSSAAPPVLEEETDEPLNPTDDRIFDKF